ncbi:class A beta-lactamase [Sulfitobacter geojensis]|uniref:class A beta-lactamase n=1 Tax=Sulfitobacter geojensis TaxID=1342299 RepID=UPI0009ED4065
MNSVRHLVRGVWLVFLCGGLSGPADAELQTLSRLGVEIRALEKRHDARIGVMVRHPASGWYWGYRENERFLMNSTFKSVLCAAILYQVDRQVLDLNTKIKISGQDILHYAPVTKKNIGSALPISDLCFATLDQSDNTAANLLINLLGGPKGVMTYLDRINDAVTRLDRIEPSLNDFVAGDPRDTTSPAAMTATWQKMLTGDALRPTSRAQLAEWMRHGSVTQEFLRKSAPIGWQIIDKSGDGRKHTRSIVAMMTPLAAAPYFVAIYVSDTPASWVERNAIVAEIGRAIIDIITAR